MRRSVPNWLIRSGWREPFGCSNRSAGPPALTVRSTISVISRSGSTSAATRTSSPSRSRRSIHSRRSAGGAIAVSRTSVRSVAAAPVAQPPRRLAERDHGDEDQADDQHPDDDVDALPRRRPRAAARSWARLYRTSRDIRTAWAASARSTSAGTGSPPSRRAAVDPGRAVVRAAFGPQRRAAGDQLGERRDRVDVAERRDPDEAVRVEVVAEQERHVVVGGREQPRPAVVDEVAPRRSSRTRARTAPGRAARRPAPAPARRAQRLRPERALAGRLRRRARPRGQSRRSRQRPRPSGRCPRPCGRARGRGTRTATARRRSRARAGAGRGRRSDRCRSASRPRSCGSGLRQKSVAIAPTRWTRPYAREARLEPRALLLELLVDAGSRRRRSTESPAAVASGFPDSVPAW